MENRELQRLEEKVKERVNLTELSNEELIYEFFKVRKLYNGTSNRTASFIQSLKQGDYKEDPERFINYYTTMININDSIGAYNGKLIKEMGRRYGFSIVEIDEIDAKVYEDIEF